MRLLTYRCRGQSRTGCLHGDRIVDLNYAYTALLQSQGYMRAVRIADAFVPADMTGLLQGGADSLAKAKEAVEYAVRHELSPDLPVFVPLAEAKLEAPVTQPGKIICVGHNYREHIMEMGRDIPTIPVVFAKFGNTLIGPQDDIVHYPVSDQLDYEVELAVVIGKRARHVAQADALDYVAGFTVANDVTYRDLQRRTIEWLQGKTVEGTLPMGPHLVTLDELADPAQLEVSLTVNGEERQRSNTRNLVFTVPFLVEFLSNLMTLEPGDIILTGTPGGVGVAMDPPSFLKDGDVVRVEIEGLGAIENKVAAAKGR